MVTRRQHIMIPPSGNADFKNKGIVLICFLMLTWIATAQQVEVQGYVYSASDNQPLIGATVLIKGTLQGTITDQTGRFSLFAETGDTIVVQYVGYTSQSINFSGEEELRFSLEETTLDLEELVVVGYGKVRRSDVTGSVATVPADDLQQVAVSDVAQALQGRLAGVRVTAQSGEPGESMRVRIRGTGTFNNSDPVYIVDGIPYDDISFLLSSDIQNVEILKDASATAVYGSRGANGVVLITTKSGSEKAREAAIQFRVYTGIQKVISPVEMADATQYARLKLLAYTNDGIEIDNIAPSDESLYKEIEKLNYVIDNGFKGTDWQSEVLRPAAIQNYDLSFSGGGERHKYYISAGYFSQEGIVKNSDLERINLRANSEFSLKKWITGGISFAFVNNQRSYIDKDLYTGVLTTALRVDPITAAWNEDQENWGVDQFSQVNNNPARRVYESQFDRSNENQVIVNVWGDLSITDHLSFYTKFGMDYVTFKRTTYFPEFYVSTKELNAPSELYDERIPTGNLVWSGYFTYIRELANHHVNVMLGSEAQQMSSSHVKMGAYDVPLEEKSHYFSSAKNKTDFSIITNTDYLWEQNILSFFGRVNYAFRDKYLFTGTVRGDGSSKFSEENRWGIFPSFSLGWNMKKEGFLQQLDFISDLKLRIGWGKVGNEGSVRNYQYLSTMQPDQVYVFGDQIVEGRIPTTMSNPELRWEVAQMTNVGLDAGLLDRTLQFTLEYFYKTTKDILVITPIPYYFGTGAPYDNAADLSNWGIEFNTLYRKRISENLNFQIGFNIDRIRNNVVSLGGADIIEGGKIGKLESFTTRTEEGEELAYFYGYRTDGVFNTQEELESYVNKEGNPLQPTASPGDLKFVDTDKDGDIDADDKVKLGSGHPDFTFGLHASLFYRGFDLQLFLHGSYGNEAINALTGNMRNPDGIENSHASRIKSWTPENPGSNSYRMSYSDPNRNIMTFSDVWIEDASYVRVKNIQIGYTLKNELVRKIRLESIRIYLSADNLFTFTSYSGWDPEIGELYYNPFNNGIDMGTYPHARIFMAGVNMAF